MNCECKKDMGLLVLRIALAIVFIYHGYGKIMNPEMFIPFFESIGLSAFWFYLAAYSEFMGGILMALGLLTRYTALVLSIIMMVAIDLVHLKNGYSAMAQGYEYQLTLFLVAIALALTGGGKFSLDSYMCEGPISTIKKHITKRKKQK